GGGSAARVTRVDSGRFAELLRQLSQRRLVGLAEGRKRRHDIGQHVDWNLGANREHRLLDPLFRVGTDRRSPSSVRRLRSATKTSRPDFNPVALSMDALTMS